MILFDAPNLELYYSTVVKDQPLTLVGKSDINRKDRHRTMRIPSCNDGMNPLYLDVVLSLDEQLSIASLGDVEDSTCRQYLRVEYQPEEPGSSAIGFEMVKWVFPTEVYRTLRQRIVCLGLGWGQRLIGVCRCFLLSFVFVVVCFWVRRQLLQDVVATETSNLSKRQGLSLFDGEQH